MEELALEKYKQNGRGITFNDVIKKFHCKKDKAQLRLKNACIEHVKDGKKSSVLFTLDNDRTKPQQYFPSSIKATIIENKRNRLIGTTGDSYSNKRHSSSTYPLHNAIEQQMVSSLLIQLSILPFQPLNMHNIHLWMRIDKSHYEEINQKPWYDNNKTKIQKERISLNEVVYKFNKNGSIEIEISCSKNPFKIETNEDINNFFVFLGKVQDRLTYILCDPRERIIPAVTNWILKYCDFNKDVEIDDKNIGQLMGLNMQVKHAGEAFRLYVKNLDDRFVIREERIMKVDQPISLFMKESILNPFHLIQDKINEGITTLDKKINEVIKRIET